MEKKWKEWEPQPFAEILIRQVLGKAFLSCGDADNFRRELLRETGIRFRDILDHIIVPPDFVSVGELSQLGWEECPEEQAGLFRNHRGFFPAIIAGEKLALGFKVEHVGDFARHMLCSDTIRGRKYSRYRTCLVWTNSKVEFHAVERNGYAGFRITDETEAQLRQSRIHLQSFRARRRHFTNVEAGFDYTDKIVEAAVSDLGRDWACSLFLRAERDYWEMRNYAGRLQKQRQDAMGIGWANHDHHTYDSSREHFRRTISILETLGFECRERFYAGADAGWGSQILEQPQVGSIVFADIDLAPEELEIDFAHEPIDPLPDLRRAGLWTELHGESMLEAGLNHLECMYDSQSLHQQLTGLGIEMMKPFSDFPHLYQELTVGEWWAVAPDKVDALEKRNLISARQAEDFRLNGAIGSHFENLERNDGYKGFNKPGIDGVLRIIDPRKNLKEAAQA